MYRGVIGEVGEDAAKDEGFSSGVEGRASEDHDVLGDEDVDALHLADRDGTTDKGCYPDRRGPGHDETESLPFVAEEVLVDVY